jgi:hypothetical protein
MPSNTPPLNSLDFAVPGVLLVAVKSSTIPPTLREQRLGKTNALLQMLSSAQRTLKYLESCHGAFDDKIDCFVCSYDGDVTLFPRMT